MYVRPECSRATKTSALLCCQSVDRSSPCFVFLSESLSWMYVIALIVMVIGSALVVVDTLIRQRDHEHQTFHIAMAEYPHAYGKAFACPQALSNREAQASSFYRGN